MLAQAVGAADHLLEIGGGLLGPRLAPLARHVPAALAAVIDRALSFETEARWADARELYEAWINTPV
jgi:hypothetical protein